MQWKNLPAMLARLRKDKKTALCLVAGLLGALLLLFSGSGAKKPETTGQDWSALCTNTERALEQRAEKLLSSVAGVGRVRVIVTLENLESYVYARDTQRDGETGRETEDHVLVSASNEQNGLTERVVMPAVRGVAVSCEGGASPQVQREVSGLICAAFGISANRVYIGAMKK